MLGRSVFSPAVAVGLRAGRRGLSSGVWKKHGKPPLTKIVATIGPASEHMPTLQQ
jgi:hypothetical protein